MKPQAQQSRNPLGGDKVLSIILMSVSLRSHHKETSEMAETCCGICCPYLLCGLRYTVNYQTTCKSRHHWNQSTWPNYYYVTKENTTAHLICLGLDERFALVESLRLILDQMSEEKQKLSFIRVQRERYSQLAEILKYLKMITLLLQWRQFAWKPSL